LTMPSKQVRSQFGAVAAGAGLELDCADADETHATSKVNAANDKAAAKRDGKTFFNFMIPSLDSKRAPTKVASCGTLKPR
jgi:hypothetical protein